MDVALGDARKCRTLRGTTPRIAWKRSLRLSSALRRWINIIRAALHRWYCSFEQRLLGRTRLSVERLEDIEAAGSLLPMAASALGAAALVRTVDQPSQTPALEKPSGITDAAMDAPTEEAKRYPIRYSANWWRSLRPPRIMSASWLLPINRPLWTARSQSTRPTMPRSIR